MNLSKPERIFTIIFTIIVLWELFADQLQELLPFHFAPKPLILTSLIIFFISQWKHLSSSSKYITLFALIFSLTGDVLLMFVETSANFFLGGLVAFLIAHIMYILLFLKKKNQKKPSIPFSFVLIIYALGLFYVLKDGLGDMLIPVIVYMLVILSMALSASLRKGMVSNSSYNLVFIGAIFFMISDSILAVNKFYNPVPMSGILIMSTYALAQYLIVIGVLRQEK